MEDILGSKQKDSRSFKENLVTFWDTLVRESQEGALFDQQLMEKCMDHVIALSWYVEQLSIGCEGHASYIYEGDLQEDGTLTPFVYRIRIRDQSVQYFPTFIVLSLGCLADRWYFSSCVVLSFYLSKLALIQFGG